MHSVLGIWPVWLALAIPAAAGVAVFCAGANRGAAGLAPARAVGRRILPDFELVVRRIASYLALAASIAVLWLAMVSAARVLFDMPDAAESIPFNALFIVATAMLFKPLRTRILASVESILYRSRAARRNEFRAAASDVFRTMSRRALAVRLTGRLAAAMKGPPVSLLLTSQDGRTFDRVTFAGDDGAAKYLDPPEECRIAGPAADMLRSGRQIVAAWDSPEGISMPEGSEPAGAAGRPVLAVPLVQKERLSGALLVGPAFEGPFTSEDSELLQICANHAAIAFENSALYEQVLAMKDYYDNIIQSMTTGLLTFGPDGKLRKFNAAACAMLGLSPERARGAGAAEALSEIPDLASMATECLHGRGAFPSEMELAVPGDPGRILSASVSSIRDTNGNPAGASVLLADVTARKELEHRLERNRRLAYIGELASGVAHEIKNPLGSIRLFVESLDDDFDDPDLRNSFVDLVLPEIDSLDTMLRNLLDFSRPSDDPEAESDAAGIMRTTLDFLAPEIRRNSVELRTLLGEEEIMVPCDGEKLKRALTNITLNAVESMSASGMKTLTVSAAAGKGRAEIEISDTGTGISPENLDKIFKPFFTTKPAGTGLGLPMAQKVIEESGGSISVSSEAGRGTTVVVRLPLKQSSSSPCGAGG